MARLRKQHDATWAEYAKRQDKYGWPLSGRYHLLNRDSIKRLGELRGSASFIVADDLLPQECDFCRKTIEVGGGNRASYSASRRVLAVMHYGCSWNFVLGLVHAQAFGPVHVADRNGVEYVMKPNGQRILVT